MNTPDITNILGVMSIDGFYKARTKEELKAEILKTKKIIWQELISCNHVWEDAYGNDTYHFKITHRADCAFSIETKIVSVDNTAFIPGSKISSPTKFIIYFVGEVANLHYGENRDKTHVLDSLFRSIIELFTTGRNKYLTHESPMTLKDLSVQIQAGNRKRGYQLYFDPQRQEALQKIKLF